ncbi:unnamed protein product [Parascedosporium putredinis]|uniref:Cytochrome P450 n=1 Tax=Parascedosporium putredinis TaxID=1442378 RepID=A0A9P1MDW7_9PEZI|nr:unnamed protein product [Parascedosporium putredinis]CAI8000395.1 unnamed protein product [Parascedosporium putredinis]
MTYQLVGVAALAVAFLLYKFAYQTDIPEIKNLPTIPGIPIFGNLFQLGTDHARVAAKWAKKYGPVFQTRLGTKRVIFVNSYDAVRYFWIKNQSALISRPMFHTFHSVVSTSQGFTIGTSPWDESCKKRRKAAGTALNRPAVQSYMPILDLESTASIKELLEDSRRPRPDPYFARFALNTSLTLNYGFRISGNVDSALLKEITMVEREISNFRSTSNNWQDYVPLLRLWGAQNPKAKEFRDRRDKYLSDMLADLKDRIAKGTDKPCITGNILKDPDAKLNEAELKSICLTMVSAGLDTVPGNLIMGLAYLSTDHGQEIQEKALQQIQEVYPNGDAWEKCLEEEKVPYVTALVKETLRFWTVIPICLPNAWAADYDDKRFASPSEFQPERFLDDPEGGTPTTPTVPARASNRELFTAYVRLITAFRIAQATEPRDRPVIDAIECNSVPTALTTDPKPFKISLKARDEPMLRKWIAAAEERTNHL